MRKLSAALLLLQLGLLPARARAQAPDPIIAVLLGAGQYAADVSLDRIRVRQLTVVGRASDIARVLQGDGRIVLKNCECLLTSANVGECVVKNSRRAAVPLALRRLPEKTVRIIPTATAEFVTIFNAIHRRYPPGGAGSKGPPGFGSRPPQIGPCSTDNDGCTTGGNLEVSTTGEAKYSFGCENGAKIEISSNGAIDLKISTGKVTMSVPLRTGAS